MTKADQAMLDIARKVGDKAMEKRVIKMIKNKQKNTNGNEVLKEIINRVSSKQ